MRHHRAGDFSRGLFTPKITVILAAAVAALAAAYLLTCSKDERDIVESAGDLGVADTSFTESFPGLPEPETLELGSGWPRVYVGARSLIRGELETSTEHLLDGDYVLEFLPLARAAEADRVGRTAAKRESPSLLTYVLTEEGGAEAADAVSVSTPVGLETERLDDWERIRTVSAPVLVDLSRYGGQRVRFRWEVTPEIQVYLANLTLRPKAAVTDPTARRPDILWICSDAHRVDHAIGQEGRALMPRLHRQLAEAVVYPRAVSNASWTLPAIASALTGLFPRYHLAGHLDEAVPAEEFSEEALPAGRFAFEVGDIYRVLTTYPRQLHTLPEYVAPLGYRTALVAANPLYFLSGVGFDGQHIAVDTGVVKGEKVNESAARIIDSTPSDRPLFLLVHYMDVHQWNWWYFNPVHGSENKKKLPQEVAASYARAVEDTDRQVEALLAKWRSSRDFDASLVVFFSDHGEHLLDPGSPRMLGHGNSMDELLLRVPLMVKYPAGIDATVEGVAGSLPPVVSLIDLPATVLDLLGLEEPPATFSGISLLDPGLLSRSDDRSLFADFQLYGDSLSSVRRGEHKLVIDLDAGRPSLYQVLYDPVGAARMDLSKQLEEELLAAFRRYRDTATERTRELLFVDEIDQEEALEQLRALGYVR